MARQEKNITNEMCGSCVHWENGELPPPIDPEIDDTTIRTCAMGSYVREDTMVCPRRRMKGTKLISINNKPTLIKEIIIKPKLIKETI